MVRLDLDHEAQEWTAAALQVNPAHQLLAGQALSRDPKRKAVGQFLRLGKRFLDTGQELSLLLTLCLGEGLQVTRDRVPVASGLLGMRPDRSDKQ
jgi:hypothetical protein